MSKILNLLIIFKILFYDKIKCFEQNPKNNSQNINFSSEKTSKDNKRKLEPIFKPIKIYVDTYGLKNQLNSKEGKKRFAIYTSALERAKNTLENLIEVKNTQEKIDLEKYKTELINFFEFDYNYYIDSNLINKKDEFDSDLIIYVREDDGNLMNCNELPTIIQYNSEGRPISGFIIIDEDYYEKTEDSPDEKYKIELYSYIILHQFTHILGFSYKLLNEKNLLDIKYINRLDKDDQKKNY